jgi:hypothetical protein
VADPVDELVEMPRGFMSRRVYNVFDAVSKARRTAKNKLLAEIIDEWAAARVHEASLIQRLSRGNGNDSHSDWAELSE